MLNATYQVNSPDVVHETIDGEVVMVHLGNGSYYCLDGVGAEIWSLLADGVALHRVVETIGGAYSGDAENIQQSILQLAEKLCSEQLLAPGPADASQSSAPLSAYGSGRPQFVAPVLHKYTDMEQLLLVDPIHDVAEAGWPHIQDETAP